MEHETSVSLLERNQNNRIDEMHRKVVWVDINHR